MTSCSERKAKTVGGLGNAGPQSGFTLIELLVVLTVLAFAVLAIPPVLRQTTGTATFMTDAQSFAATLNEARSVAIMESRDVVVYLDVENRRYHVDQEGQSTTIAEDVHLVLKTARSEQTSEAEGGIRFFPNGASTGGQVTFERRNKRVLVTVNWVTGKVTRTR